MSTTQTISMELDRNSFGFSEFSSQPIQSLNNVALRDNFSTDFVDYLNFLERRTTPQKKEILSPSPRATINREADIDAAVIQLWEGRVLEVDTQNETMQVLLSAKIGQIPEHTGQLELQWVSDQDRDLVVPGAVFYLTLFKKTRRGSIQNAQELRFRRRPSWTRMQVQKVYSDAEKILNKMRPLPIAT